MPRSAAATSGRYWVSALYVSLVAAVAARVCIALSLEIWAMFIGWTCFGTGAGSVKRGAAATGCLLLGLILAMGSIVALKSLQPLIGTFALPLVVFMLAMIAMLSVLTPPVDSIPGYFLGMTAFYASHLQPGIGAFIHLAGVTLLGAVGGWLLVSGPKLLAGVVCRSRGPRATESS